MSEDTKWIVFIDALSPNDLERCDFMPTTMQGRLESTPPRVTPKIMGSVYTGLDSAENGIMRKHAGGGADPDRPAQSTIMERADKNGLDVLNLYMPYCIPQRLGDGSASIGASAGGKQNVTPQQIAAQVSIPGPQGDLVGEQRHDIVFDHFVDYTNQLFSTARTLAPNFDVVFIGFRLIDSYCHFQYDAGADGRGAEVGERYRDRLAEIVDIQLKQLETKGDVFWFSDHGATERTETFRINKWLKDQGYLDYKVDEDFRSKARDYGMLEGEQHPVKTRVENQFVIGSPGVTMSDDSKAFCADPYDSCITLKDESVKDELIRDLKKLDVFRDVYHKSELFDTEGKFYDDLPDIIPDRAEGVFVSGNVHPDPIGMGWYRTGVHDKWGCYGSTTELEGGKVTPEKMYYVLEKFLDIDRGVSPVPNLPETLTEAEKNAVKNQLR